MVGKGVSNMKLKEELLKIFAELTEEEQEKLLNYYACSLNNRRNQSSSEFRHPS